MSLPLFELNSDCVLEILSYLSLGDCFNLETVHPFFTEHVQRECKRRKIVTINASDWRRFSHRFDEHFLRLDQLLEKVILHDLPRRELEKILSKIQTNCLVLEFVCLGGMRARDYPLNLVGLKELYVYSPIDLYGDESFFDRIGSSSSGTLRGFEVIFDLIVSNPLLERVTICSDTGNHYLMELAKLQHLQYLTITLPEYLKKPYPSFAHLRHLGLRGSETGNVAPLLASVANKEKMDSLQLDGFSKQIIKKLPLFPNLSTLDVGWHPFLAKVSHKLGSLKHLTLRIIYMMKIVRGKIEHGIIKGGPQLILHFVRTLKNLETLTIYSFSHKEKSTDLVQQLEDELRSRDSPCSLFVPDHDPDYICEPCC